ncbi:MAG TPA: adenylate/guanylate cyclase domain-containing protein [Gaiellaceae bacterium]|nr:adenylate/guanylate cyclase domain-containing protein [Gaiellaceae bacterium]
MDEQRLVSVLFADLVGFTSRSHGADPAVIRALQRPFHARVKHEVERRGGRVEKFIGDAVVAVFGADDGDRNDTERAVRVALRIPEVVEELNEEQPGLDLAVRVGVNSDTVTVDRDGDEAVGVVTGDIVNVAGKLQGAAPPGGVAVCQTTYERTCARFRYTSLASVTLPGRVEPEPVWQPAPRRRRGRSGDLVEELAAADEEIRDVTILFVDLVDFSLRAHSADPEEMRALLRPYFGAIRHEVDRFGGTVEKFLGDSVMAVFGAPVARVDDAERAVRAALRLPEVVVELNEDDAFREVAVRAAVNSGDAAVALGARLEAGESMVTGDTVNTAARLLGAAPVGGVVVGEATWERTRDAVDYEALPPIHAKGKPEPVPLWRALAAQRHALDVPTAREPEFVGRGPELSQLKGGFARVLLERKPQVVVLSGPPGIGKTRIVSEFHASTNEREDEVVEWRTGQSLPYGGAPFSALGDLVKNAAAILKSDGIEEAEPKLAAAVRSLTSDAAERRRLEEALAPLAGIAPEDEPDLEGWTRFVELAAAQRPLVCLFEDVQDETTREFVEHVADTARGRLLVVATTGHEGGGWALGRENVTHVDVGRLGEPALAALLESLDADLPAELAAGNPLHAVELARLGRPLAGGLDEVVEARLAALSPEQRRAVEAGAVVGRTFWGGAVAALTGLDVQEACRLLDQAVAVELLQSVRVSTVAREAEYGFLHPLVRELVYARADRGLHVAAAEWLDHALGGRADHDVLVAYHTAAAL